MDMADYLDVTGDMFSDLRVLVEGALSLIEDHTGSLNRLLRRLVWRKPVPL